MTKERAHPAMQRHRGGNRRTLFHGAYISIIIVIFLSSCGGGSVLPGSIMGSSPTTGRESEAQNPAISDVIFVVPPEGAAPQTGLILADAIAAELRDRNHPAILAFQPNQAGASIIGEVSAAEPNGNVVWLAVDWSVRAPYGTLIDTYRQQVVIDKVLWTEGGAEAINLLVGDASPKILEMVRAHIGPPMLAAMRRPEPPAPDVSPASIVDPMVAENVVHEAPNAQTVLRQQPLARIADATNGRVVMSDGTVPETAEEPTREILDQQTTVAAAPLESLLIPVPTEKEIETASTRPPLPSLLEDPVAPTPVASSAPPQALVPGAARSVAPPPGGVAPEAAGTEDDGSFLDALSPNMDTEARRPGDARPQSTDEVAFSQVRWGQPAFLIRPVNGATGNGNQALTAGLKSALRARDLTISEDPRQAGFVIDGDVDMGPPASGRQFVRITWRVSTVAGDEVGRAVQENTVIAGSLDGEWGQVAEAVSNAAVRGIQDLFGAEDTSQASREPLPSFPDIALPEIPGRAPPPPTGY